MRNIATRSMSGQLLCFRNGFMRRRQVADRCQTASQGRHVLYAGHRPRRSGCRSTCSRLPALRRAPAKAPEGKVVGNCEGETKQIIYKRN